jgi:Na+/proline symporter
VAALASSLGLVFSLTLVGIVYYGMHKIGPPAMEDGELHIMHYLDQGISPWLRPLLPIAFFAIFITTYEGMLNWGASFLSIDGYQTYVDKDASPRKMKRVSTGSMLLITALSLSICWYTENLTSLIKILLSISAGVAPVFVLRWFWMRINAWSQLAAMLSSGVYTLLYRAYVSGTWWEQQAVELSGLNAYSIQLIAITVSTTATWIGVMYTTQKDDTALLEKFKATFATGIDLRSNLVKALVFGLVMVGILVAGLMWVVEFL